MRNLASPMEHCHHSLVKPPILNAKKHMRGRWNIIISPASTVHVLDSIAHFARGLVQWQRCFQVNVPERRHVRESLVSWVASQLAAVYDEPLFIL